MKNNHLLYQTILTALICFCILTGSGQIVTAKEDIKTICILPFNINASQDLIYLQEGISHMLYSRLSWRDNVVVFPGKKFKDYLSNTDKTSGIGGGGINKIAKLTHSDFVLTGTVTKLAGSFSIDVQIYDIENKRYITFFEQSQKTDDLIDKVNRIASFINKKVFDRTTKDWLKMEYEQQAYIRELQRRNPEYMIKNLELYKKKQSPGWKIWKYVF